MFNELKGQLIFFIIILFGFYIKPFFDDWIDLCFFKFKIIKPMTPTTDQIQNHFTDIGFKQQPHEKVETPRVYLDSGVYVNGKYMGVLEQGKRVCVKDGQLCNGDETHEITSLRCTIFGYNPEISVVDLKTLELSNIVL